MTGKMKSMAKEVAKAARKFQQQRPGHTPKAVTVVLSEGALVITLHGALTPAERAMAAEPAGALKVQDLHRQLFASASDQSRKEIKRVTGVEVPEAAAEVKTSTGTVVHAFSNGTMVQVIQLARHVEADSCTSTPLSDAPRFARHTDQDQSALTTQGNFK